MRQEQGFTIIELLLSLAILGIVASLSMPAYFSFQQRNDLAMTTETIATMLRRAQTYTRAVHGDSQWGVAIQASTATLFKGTSYAGRDSSYDETASINSNITASGLHEVTFSKLYGMPGSIGAINLATANDTRIITINAKGMVSY